MYAGMVLSDKAVAFESLFRNYRKRAWAFAYRLCGNREDADDLLQDASVRAFRAFDSFDRTRSFERWFYRILDNQFKDRLRARKRAIVVSLDSPVFEDDEKTTEIPDDRNDPEELLMRQVTDERILTALARVPVPFRQTLIHTDVEGHSYEETAAIMGCSIGTVRSRLHRGRKLMRQGLIAQRAR